MQTYGSAPGRVNSVAPGTKRGLIERTMAKPAPAKPVLPVKGK